MNHCAAILVKEVLITQIVLDAIANAELSVLQLAVPLQVCVGIASLRVKCRIVLVRVVTVQLQFFSSQNTQDLILPARRHLRLQRRRTLSRSFCSRWPRSCQWCPCSTGPRCHR